MAEETRETMIKRLRMRSMRRGIKEMDLILIAFSQARLAQMQAADLATYDALLSEYDHDIYGWITGQAETPARYRDMVAEIQVIAQGVVKPE